MHNSKVLKNPVNYTYLCIIYMYCLFFFQRGEKLEDLNLLFINIHHLINELRPHQVCNIIFFILHVKYFLLSTLDKSLKQI